MATFDATQIAKLVRILQIDAVTLTDRLDFYASSISNEMKTEVESLIAEYEAGTVSRNVTKIHPNLKNFGAEINPSNLRSMIKGEIANYLFCTDLLGANSGARLMRG